MFSLFDIASSTTTAPLWGERRIGAEVVLEEVKTLILDEFDSAF